MDLTSILIGLATQVGAPIVESVLTQKFGPDAGKLTDVVIKSIATAAGGTVETLPTLATESPEVVKAAIQSTEAIAPELVGLYTAGLQGQFALLQAESAEGPLQSGWRWGWMYLLAVFWIWVILIVPIVGLLGAKVPVIDLGVLMTLTSWFIALYMGGHTIQELGKTALDAVKSWKGQG